MSKPKHQVVYERLLKSEHIFFAKMLDTDFTEGLAELAKKYRPKELSTHNVTMALHGTDSEINEAFDTYRQRFRRSLNDLMALPIDKAKECTVDIFWFLYQFDLGKEWFNSTLTLILKNWFFPADFNLFVTKTDKEIESQRVVLELNPDTSLEDIEFAWKYIQGKQKELWPGFKRTNYSKKTAENLNIALADLRLRTVNGKKINDLDMVAKIWPTAEDDSTIFESLKDDQKKKNNLRQIRRRYKK